MNGGVAPYIAAQELGDKERWKEIAGLNWDVYPTIGKDNKDNFIEVGWKLLLPPREVHSDSIHIQNAKLIIAQNAKKQKLTPQP